ncbi:MAG: SpoIIE family protein phosphatase [Smithellaceae bacterium]
MAFSMFNDKRSDPVRPGKGIAFRLSFWILLSVIGIFTLVFGYYYMLSRDLIVKKIEKQASEQVRGTAARIDMVLAATQKIPENLSVVLSGSPLQEERKLFGLIKSILARNSEIYGMAVAFEPYFRDRNVRHFSPYVYKENGGIASTRIAYDYFSWDWYRLPRESLSPVWVEPYFDEGAGNIVMSTYSVPFYRSVDAGNELAGIVTVDISLAWLQKLVSDIRIGETGYAFLISQKGTLVTHPDAALIMNKTIFDLADERGDTSLRDIASRMTGGETALVEARDLLDGGDLCWLAFTPLSTTGWSLGLVFPRNELMADVSRLYRLTLLFSAFGLLLLFCVIVWIARSITRPLRLLTAATQTMAEGRLDEHIPAVRRADEVGRLAASFAAMRASLQTHISDLTKTTAAKEKIESELKIAHDIQMGMLPRTFPPFPRRNELDVFAMLKPAREVGGDLYDFFFMDNDHFCFTVGDVSGKGVPAALHMAITKILIKTKAQQGLPPETILARCNEDLAMDNPSMMFVTLFLGVLNVRTGALAYCSAGHPSACLLRAGEKVDSLPAENGMALGVVDDFVYRSRTVTLQKNDCLFLYTDGVTEAADVRDELFDEARLMQALEELKDRDVQDITDGVLERIEDFAGYAPQADDITMLAVRYKGKR